VKEARFSVAKTGELADGWNWWLRGGKKWAHAPRHRGHDGGYRDAVGCSANIKQRGDTLGGEGTKSYKQFCLLDVVQITLVGQGLPSAVGHGLGVGSAPFLKEAEKDE